MSMSMSMSMSLSLSMSLSVCLRLSIHLYLGRSTKVASVLNGTLFLPNYNSITVSKDRLGLTYVSRYLQTGSITLPPLHPCQHFAVSNQLLPFSAHIIHSTLEIELMGWPFPFESSLLNGHSIGRYIYGSHRTFDVVMSN